MVSNLFRKAVVINTGFAFKEPALNARLAASYLFNLGKFTQVP